MWAFLFYGKKLGIFIDLCGRRMPMKHLEGHSETYPQNEQQNVLNEGILQGHTWKSFKEFPLGSTFAAQQTVGSDVGFCLDLKDSTQK